jgi:hypothetical protein
MNLFLIKDVNAEKIQELAKLLVRVRIEVAPSLVLSAPNNYQKRTCLDFWGESIFFSLKERTLIFENCIIFAHKFYRLNYEYK